MTHWVIVWDEMRQGTDPQVRMELIGDEGATRPGSLATLGV
ncbi:MAG: hypothetical protein RQ745_10890 [Longimicrobiales bacterium]|nr:hypothetical protein [Longimicrobiales bacterium]